MLKCKVSSLVCQVSWFVPSVRYHLSRIIHAHCTLLHPPSHGKVLTLTTWGLRIIYQAGGQISGIGDISQAYNRHISGKSQANPRQILGICQAYLMHISGISQANLRQIQGISLPKVSVYILNTFSELSY